MIKIIKNIFVKEKKYHCIVFNGKTMSYPYLNINQIKEYEKKGFLVTIKEDS